jgi:PPOX class probable F420-dependent enzyme
MNDEQSRSRFTLARSARFASVDDNGDPHLVPIVFALVRDTIYFVIDFKPKKTTAGLKRLANIRSHPRVAVLVDHYDDDWNQLWWARADGRAVILDEIDPDALAALADRYPQYQQAPPGPMVAITVERWTGWAAVG